MVASGDRPALIDGPTGLTVTYDLLASRVDRVAAGLAARGFGPGDVLALWAPNLPPWAGSQLGAMAAGGTVTGANPACTERELVGQLADSGASVLVTIPTLAPAACSAAASAGVGEVVVLGEAEASAPDRIRRYANRAGPTPLTAPTARRGANRTASVSAAQATTPASSSH